MTMAQDDATENLHPDDPGPPEAEARGEATPAGPPLPNLADAPSPYAYHQQADTSHQLPRIKLPPDLAGAPSSTFVGVGLAPTPGTIGPAFVPRHGDNTVPTPRPVDVDPDGWAVVNTGSGLIDLAAGLAHLCRERRALPSVVCIDARGVVDADVLFTRLQEFVSPLADVMATEIPAPGDVDPDGVDLPPDEFDRPPAWLGARDRPAAFVPPRCVVLLDPDLLDGAKATAAEQFGTGVVLIPATVGIAARDAYEEFMRRTLASFSNRAAQRRASVPPPPTEARNILTPEQKAAFVDWSLRHRDDD